MDQLQQQNNQNLSNIHSQSMDQLRKENAALQKTVKDLKEKLDKSRGIAEDAVTKMQGIVDVKTFLAKQVQDLQTELNRLRDKHASVKVTLCQLIAEKDARLYGDDSPDVLRAFSCPEEFQNITTGAGTPSSSSSPNSTSATPLSSRTGGGAMAQMDFDNISNNSNNNNNKDFRGYSQKLFTELKLEVKRLEGTNQLLSKTMMNLKKENTQLKEELASKTDQLKCLTNCVLALSNSNEEASRQTVMPPPVSLTTAAKTDMVMCATSSTSTSTSTSTSLTSTA